MPAIGAVHWQLAERAGPWRDVRLLQKSLQQLAAQARQIWNSPAALQLSGQELMGPQPS